ncbi:MAG: NADH-quinone oxidoreductase subunit L [bacterium]|nr:NADH-quinone oxidoreductase subunit L [bacterium]
MIDIIYLTIILPLLGFLVNGLFGRKIKRENIIGTIGSGVIGLSFLIAVGALIETISLPVDKRLNIVTLFDWIKTGGISLSISYQVDQLSLVMALIVTGVGFIIHVYSIGYMHGDKSFWRFFAYMNLFVFFMMNLILADNFPFLFIGWEGVGLSSFLLIGFWYEKKFEKSTTSAAALKAFVVNRVGDVGFLLGMFLIYSTFGSLTFTEVFSRAVTFNVPEYIFGFIAVFLLIGAVGKSAQIPLFVWLPDAMAGPTPVSALIHAATMVTAGVYLLARTNIIYASAPSIMLVVAVIGISTAFFAATVGIVQNDIKKVLAYSTISQLGYMFLAMGAGAFSSGIFHLMTHAFFKALLFLGAGSVIHSMHDVQDMRKFGGLKKYMPVTSLTFLIASATISGIPPLSGFFSKDEILWYSFMNIGFLVWLLGIITAAFTAIYIFRIYFMTFEGKETYDHNKIHPHESPKVMTIPLIALAVLSAVGGFIGLPEIISGENGNVLHNWLAPVFKSSERKLMQFNSFSHLTEHLLMFISVAVALSAILYTGFVYLRKPGIALRTSVRFKRLYNLLLNKYFVDEVYDATIVNPVVKGSQNILWKITDNKLIDGFVNGIGKLINIISASIRKIQTGVVQDYAILMAIGILAALLWLLVGL